MSDAPNGPGWWLASDGKWYPPQPPAPGASQPVPGQSTPIPGQSTPLPGQPMPTSSTVSQPGFPQPTGSVPGVTTGAPGYGASPTPPPVPGFGAPSSFTPYSAAPEQKQGKNGLAVASLVLALVWVCGLGSLLAIIFGIIALKQIKKKGQGGRGLAIAGLVIGSLGLVASVIAGVLIATQVKVDSSEKDDVKLISCVTQESGKVLAKLEITNDSSKPSTYIVVVDFGDQVGLSGEVTSGEVVQPGETIAWEIESTETTAGDVNCSLKYVNRLAAN
jgi:hypothetical protein